MVVGKRFEPPDLIIATLQGVVTPHDQADVVDWIRTSIGGAGSVRVLIVLDGFGGWRPDASLYDATSWLDEEEGVSMMAIVGHPEWRDSIFTLIAQPIRRQPIRYFDTEAAARQWLGAEGRAATPAAPN
jgi:hypothetical protein